MKYRILKKGNLYYPQMRTLFFFWTATNTHSDGDEFSYSKQEDALYCIEKHAEWLKKVNKKAVVWKGEL